jgi:hypothetical protein
VGDPPAQTLFQWLPHPTLIRLEMLDLEVVQDIRQTPAEHRSLEQVGTSDPAVKGIEIAPDADEGHFLSPVRVSLPSDLGKYDPVGLAGTDDDPLGLLSKRRHALGANTATKDADYQVTPRIGALGPSSTPTTILGTGARFGNYRCVSACLVVPHRSTRSAKSASNDEAEAQGPCLQSSYLDPELPVEAGSSIAGVSSE